jgi:hypothetical protein
MNKTRPPAPPRWEQSTRVRPRRPGTPLPTPSKPVSYIPNLSSQRYDEFGRKAAARAFLDRAGKRGKAPPLIRRR